MIFLKRYFVDWNEINLMIRVNKYLNGEDGSFSPTQCCRWPSWAKSVSTLDEKNEWNGIYGYSVRHIQEGQIKYMKNLLDMVSSGRGCFMLLDYDSETAKRIPGKDDTLSEKYNIASGESFAFNDETIARKANIIYQAPYDLFFRTYESFLHTYLTWKESNAPQGA